MHLYVAAGLAVASEIPLAGLTEAEPGSSAGQALEVRLAPVPASLADPCRIGPNWAMSEREFLLTIAGVARFLLSGGGNVAVDPAPGRSPADAAIFVTETILGMAMQRQGRFVLRASAVAVGDSAVLFCGPSGAGKSTLAAALDRRGYALLCDDLCAVDTDASPRPLAHPGGGGLKLWAEAVDALGLDSRAGTPVRRGIEKFHFGPAGARSAGALPVAAIYHLRDMRTSGAPAIEPLRGMPALRMVSDSAYHPLLVAAEGRNAVYFEGAAALLRSARAFAFTRRLDLARLAETVTALEDHWSASAPGEAAQ